MSNSEDMVVEETPKKKSKKSAPAPEDIGEVTKITTPEIKITKGTECKHPSNDTGYHQKSADGKCRYCGQ